MLIGTRRTLLSHPNAAVWTPASLTNLGGWYSPSYGTSGYSQNQGFPTISDRSSNGRTLRQATTLDQITYDTSPAFGLDGTDDFETGSDSGLSSGNGARSFIAWANAASLAGSSKVIGGYGTNVAGEYVWMGVTQLGAFEVYDGSRLITTANGVIATGVWHMLTFTWDGTTAKVYVDNALMTPGSNSWTTATNTVLGGASGLTIGQAPNGGGSFWNGLLGNIYLCTRAFSLSEIGQIYTYGRF